MRLEWNLIEISGREPVANIPGRVAAIRATIARILRSAGAATELRADIVDGMPPGVADLDRQAAPHAFVGRQLDGIIIAQPVGDFVGDIGHQWPEPDEWPAAGCGSGSRNGLVQIKRRADAPADIADVGGLDHSLQGRDFVLHHQVELLRVAGAKIGRDPDHRAGRILAGGQVDGWRRRETVADAGTDGYISWDHLVDRPERNVALQAQKLAARAVRIVEESIATADHGVGHRLVSETKTRRPILEIALDADSAVNPVYPCDQHRRCLGVEVGPAVGHLRIRAVVIPAQAEVQSQLAADAVVVSYVDTTLNSAHTDPGKREILLDKSGIAEQKTCHRVAGIAGAGGQIGKRRAEVESPVTAIGLVFGDLTASQLAAELQRVGSSGERQTV